MAEDKAWATVGALNNKQDKLYQHNVFIKAVKNGGKHVHTITLPIINSNSQSLSYRDICTYLSNFGIEYYPVFNGILRVSETAGMHTYADFGIVYYENKIYLLYINELHGDESDEFEESELTITDNVRPMM